MSKIGVVFLTCILAGFIVACTPTTEPEDVPAPPQTPRQEQPRGDSAKKVVKDYAHGLTGSIDKTRRLQSNAELDALKTAVQSYYYENGTYPETLDDVEGYALGGTDLSRFEYDPSTGDVSLK